ncbi:AMP-binding protein [Pseudonocardia adelaidensis]|uniref:Acyl-CoA synthetase (AMP-forming)/AMP-acid ligase II n=1 Tax=Pseudonocardia adelaidensis TaxID=648754 RepID=A0ABP9NYQ0_9PSEU
MRGLHRLFEDRARETPDAAAVAAGGVAITYAELDGRANRLAGALLAAGLHADETVAVVTERHADAVVAILGVLKAGGAYALIGPHEPMGGIGLLLAAARARVVVTSGELRPRVDDGSGRPVVDLDAVGAGPVDPPDARAGSRAAVLFTAGAARPVDVDHSRLLAAYAAWAEVFRLDPGDRHLVTAAPDVPAFTGGWVRALCSGGTLVLPGRWLTVADGTTVLDTDPATAASALSADPPDSLRLVLVGGERITVAEQIRLQRRLAPGARLLNVYGTAEVAGCGTWFEAGRPEGTEPAPDRASLLGRPFPGCAVAVVGGEIRLTPPDGGAALPTGDLGRMRDDGVLEFRGRRADRVTVRGRVVDPYEAEAALAAQPEIRDAVIASSEGELVAYVVPRGEDPVRPAAVRDHLHGVVPEQDVPERVVSLAALPRDRSGRVARHVLPLPPSAVASGTGGKGGGPMTRADRSLVVRGLLTVVSLPAALVLTGVLWPGSTDLAAVPQPWAALFGVLYLVEVLAFAVGVGFLLFGRARMLREGRSPVLTTLAHLSIVWLLVSWWPQDNSYRLAAKNDWPQQAALVYTFNVTLMIAAVIVMIFVARRSRPVG